VADLGLVSLMSTRQLCGLIIAISSVVTANANAADKIEPITLQYRIWQDALAPSAFVAVFPGGLSPRLRIHWKVPAEQKKLLDAEITKLEKEGPNGKEFTAKGVWLHRGFECDIYEITPKA
jgi:hypothetical protein